jgi:hypothetical protein
MARITIKAKIVPKRAFRSGVHRKNFMVLAVADRHPRNSRDFQTDDLKLRTKSRSN